MAEYLNTRFQTLQRLNLNTFEKYIILQDNGIEYNATPWSIGTHSVYTRLGVLRFFYTYFIIFMQWTSTLIGKNDCNIIIVIKFRLLLQRITKKYLISLGIKI